MVFTGTYEHTIDAKNRLAIPSELRQQVIGARKPKSEEPVYLYVTPGEGQALCLYTEEGFEKRASDLDQSLLDSERLLEYERLLFSLANRVEIDAQGRVRLPENLLQMTGLKGEVVLLGVKDHMEIRDRAAWKQRLAELLQQQSSWLMNPRRAMGQQGRPAT